MEIDVLSEDITTHHYESEVLAKAFEEITGIKVNHQLLGEGEVVQAVQTQMQTNRNLYDGYVNDSDLIGTHSRLQQTYNLTEQMAGPWADVTLAGLGLDAAPLLRLVQGIHVVYDRLADHAVAFEHPDDRRLCFAVPWQGLTMIGTTERDVVGGPDEARMTRGEVAYLVRAANQLVHLTTTVPTEFVDEVARD